MSDVKSCIFCTKKNIPSHNLNHLRFFESNKIHECVTTKLICPTHDYKKEQEVRIINISEKKLEQDNNDHYYEYVDMPHDIVDKIYYFENNSSIVEKWISENSQFKSFFRKIN